MVTMLEKGCVCIAAQPEGVHLKARRQGAGKAALLGQGI